MSYFAKKKSLRHENCGRLGFGILPPDSDVRGPDFTPKLATPLTYLLEQVGRLLIILFVSYAVLVDVADKLDYQKATVSQHLATIEIGMVKGLAVAYYHQLPFLMLLVMVLLLQLVTLRGDRFLEPSKRTEVVFLKMTLAYMLLLFLAKSWVDLYSYVSHGGRLHRMQEQIEIAEGKFVVMVVATAIVGGVLYLIRGFINSVAGWIVVGVLSLMVLVYVFLMALGGFQWFTAFFFRNGVEGFVGDLYLLLSNGKV